MSNDRLSTTIEKTCGKELGKKFTDTLEELYPNLKTDQNLRDKYASYIEIPYLTEAINAIMPGAQKEAETLKFDDSFCNLCAMVKVGGIINQIGNKGNSSENMNRYQVAERFLHTFAAYSATEIKILINGTDPIDTNVYETERLQTICAVSSSLYLNEYKPSDSDFMEEHFERIKRCHSNPDEISMYSQFLDNLAQESVIEARAMILLGRICPDFREKMQNNHPEIKELCHLTESYPRYVFAACADMIEKKEELTGPQMLRNRINRQDIMNSAVSLTKETCDETLQKLHPSAEDIKTLTRIALNNDKDERA